jgi:adenosylcobinamide-GDP ribazoletransferase
MLKSLIIAFSMYSKIPMPHMEWKEKDMRYVLAFFPFVGVVIAGVEYVCFAAGAKLGYDTIFMSALLIVIPVIISGGIHLDGYMDTSDALSSYRSREERLEILKDAHIGAFAVIRVVMLSLLYFGAVHEILTHGEKEGSVVFILGFVLARVMSGLSVMITKPAGNKGTLEQFSTASERKTVTAMLVLEYIVTVALMIYAAPLYGGAVAVISAVWLVIYRHICDRDFGGVTGDTSGWFLCITECLCALTIAILSSHLLHP